MNQLQTVEPPRQYTPTTDRRRLKTETSASGGWAARLQAKIDEHNKRTPPQSPAPSR